LLVLDDLQWSDAFGLEVWALARPALEVAGVVTLATSRVDGLPDGLDELERLDLGALDDDGVRDLAEDMLAAPAPQGLVEHLIGVTEGNPFFVGEYLHAAVATGSLQRDERGRWVAHPEQLPVWDELPVPDALQALVRTRLEHLLPSSAEAVEIAAVLGREVDRWVLDALWERVGAPGGLDDALRDAAAHAVLEDGYAERLRFTHDQVRTMAYAGVEPSRRLVLHEGAAEACVGHAALAAPHWEAAGRLDRARLAWMEAGKQANMRPHEAGALFERAEACSPPDSEALRESQLWLGLMMLQGLGDVHGARPRLVGAATSEVAEVRLRAVGGLVYLHRLVGERDRATALAESALEEAHLASPAIRAEILGGAAQTMRARGQLERAIATWEEALVYSEDPVRRGSCHLAIANTLARLGRQREAQGRMTQAIDEFESGHTQFHRAMALLSLGGMDEVVGDIRLAREHYRESQPTFEDFGHPYLKAALLNQADVSRQLGEYARAEEELDAAAAAETTTPTTIGAYIDLVRGDLWLHTERFEEAVVLVQSWAEGADLTIAARAGLTLSLALRGLGRTAEAATALAHSLARCASAGDNVHACLGHAEGARMAREDGDLEAAADHLQAAELAMGGEGSVPGQLNVAIEQGMLAVALGRDPGPALARAVSLLARMDLRTSATPAKRVHELAAAITG
jgi:tetratricopeptide (TPR) repeat protein